MNTQSTYQWLVGDRRLRFWAWMYSVVDLIHVALPDFQQTGWLGPSVLIVLSSVLLFHRPYPIAFLLAAVAHTWTLIGLRDVLTQSMLLLLFSLVGTVLSVNWRPRLLRGVGQVTAITYLAAAVHKLNTNFLDVELSCAVHALTQVSDHWMITIPDVFMSMSPHLTLGLELALWITLSRRSRWYWLLALAFHLPLLVTLAPAFGAVMFCGAAATIDTRTLVRMRCFFHRYYRRLFVIAGLGVGLELLIGQDWLSWTQPIQVGIYILICVSVFCASQTLSVARPTNLWMSGCWFLFCLTPYVGIQFQHTAAMLSNLRVDNGCHNSLLFPSSWIGQDTYLRIHKASFGTDEWSKRETILEQGIWNEAALFTMRRKWCVEWVRPISMTIDYRGQRVEVADICTPEALSFIPAPFHHFPQFQRFQKNLTRNCNQACIH